MEAYAKKLVIVALVLALAIGHEPVAVGQTMCGMNTDGLMACRPSVAAGENPAPPSAACCAAMSGADIQCLCKYKKSRLLTSLGIDPNLAMQLPAKCNLAQAIPCA